MNKRKQLLKTLFILEVVALITGAAYVVVTSNARLHQSRLDFAEFQCVKAMGTQTDIARKECSDALAQANADWICKDQTDCWIEEVK